MWKVSIKILGNSKYGAWRKDLYSNFAKEKVYTQQDMGIKKTPFGGFGTKKNV